MLMNATRKHRVAKTRKRRLVFRDGFDVDDLAPCAADDDE